MSTNLISAISDRLVLAVYTDYSYHRDSCDFSGHPFQWYLSSRRHIMCGIPSPWKKKILSTIINSLSWQTACVRHNTLVFVNISWLCMRSDVLPILCTKNLNSQDYFLPSWVSLRITVLPFWKIRTMPDNINTTVLFWFRAMVLNLWLEDHRSNTIFETSPLYRLDFLDLI